MSSAVTIELERTDARYLIILIEAWIAESRRQLRVFADTCSQAELDTSEAYVAHLARTLIALRLSVVQAPAG